MVPTLIRQAADVKEQPDLFGSLSTIHGVVTAMGAKGAVNAAQLAMLEPKVGSLPRALAGRSGRQIADTAAAAIMREFEGGAERGYSYSAWCLAGLPHREHSKTDNWLIETDFARLLVRPGVRLRDDNSQEHIGVPHGSFARLLLVDLQSEALEKGSREIAMERSASALVSRIGVARGGPTNGKVADQLERLSTCSVDFAFGTDKQGVVVNQRLVEAFEYVSEPDRRTRGSMRLIERLMLSQAFFDELRRHPVLVDRAALRDLASSPLAIDVYLWLSYRLHALQKETPIGWERLWRQFGSRVGQLKNFKTLIRASAPPSPVRILNRKGSGDGPWTAPRAFAAACIPLRFAAGKDHIFPPVKLEGITPSSNDPSHPQALLFSAARATEMHSIQPV